MSKKAEARSKTDHTAVHREVSDLPWEKHYSGNPLFEQPAIFGPGPCHRESFRGGKSPEQRLLDSGSFVNIETLLKKLEFVQGGLASKPSRLGRLNPSRRAPTSHSLRHLDFCV